MAEKTTIQEVLDFVDVISKFIEDKQYEVPYHLNLIDEMHINENGHSRILSKLIRYQSTEGKYIFLESLFKYVANKCEKKSFGDISIENPKITQERCRIDLWVLDNDYAVIFENKVYNAKDQEAQIARYIEHTMYDEISIDQYKKKRYEKDKIYVIYLPQKDNKDPDPQTWIKSELNYKEAFKERYAKATFDRVILPWLKDDVLPMIPRKDEMLECAVVQYIDYLEGLLGVREYDKMIDNMVQTKIKDHLGWKDDQLQNNIEQLDSYRVSIAQLSTNLLSVFYESLKNKLVTQYKYSKTTEKQGEENGLKCISGTFEVVEDKIYIFIYITANGILVNLQNSPDWEKPKKIKIVTTGTQEEVVYSPLCELIRSKVCKDIESTKIGCDNYEYLYVSKDGTVNKEGKYISKANMTWSEGANFLDELINRIEHWKNAILSAEDTLE